eukprot:333616_1
MATLSRINHTNPRLHTSSYAILKHSLYNTSTQTNTTSPYHFSPSDRLAVDYAASGTNVWIFINEYRTKYNTVNHGQGFPNWNSPDFVKQAAINAISNNHNQYCLPSGYPEFVDKLVEIYSTRLNQSLSRKNVQTTIGACAGIENCCSAILNDNDDVITFEPYFDFYKYQIMHCKANLITSPLFINEQKQWEIDLNTFEKKLQNNSNIKAIILNTPQNPTGYVTSKETMDKLVSILKKYPNIIIISDEVYEDIIFDHHKHFHIAAYDGMFHRTLTVNSAAKKFSCTGWKTGWVVGPEDMIEAVNCVSRGQNWCQPTPLQVAVGNMLCEADKSYEGYDTYWMWLREMYEGKRNKILDVCINGGLDPIVPEGSFFCVADAKYLIDKLVEKGEIEDDSNFDINNSLTWMDWKLSKYLAINAGVTSLPMSAFLETSFEERYRYLRFSFCATDDAFERSLKGMSDMANELHI